MADGLTYLGGSVANSERIRPVAREAATELASAMEKFGPIASAHEGFAVIKEELDELWDEVKDRDADPERMREEATQVAAMALRFIIDVCPRSNWPDPLPATQEEK